MIKVLIVIDKLSHGESTIHGVTQLLSWWLPRFNQNRFQVDVCCLRSRDIGGEYLENVGIRVFYLNRGKFDPRTLLDLLRLTHRQEIDLLHLHGYGASTFGRMCGGIRNISCIVHEHIFDKGIPWYQRLADFMLKRFTVRSIAVTESVKNFLVNYRSIPVDKIDVIYNSVPLDNFTSVANQELLSGKNRKILSGFKILPSHMTVAVIGRLHPIKGHSFFLKAAQIVLKTYKDVTFLIVGDGELMGTLKTEAKALGIADHVVFTGFLSNVSDFLAEIDIKVICSLSEGLPLALLEAMAVRCAIVSTAVGGIVEIIKDGDTGLLVPPEDPKILAEKILFLLKNPLKCREFGEKAHETIQKFNVNHTVKQLEACFVKAVNR